MPIYDIWYFLTDTEAKTLNHRMTNKLQNPLKPNAYFWSKKKKNNDKEKITLFIALINPTLNSQNHLNFHFHCNSTSQRLKLCKWGIWIYGF